MLRTESYYNILVNGDSGKEKRKTPLSDKLCDQTTLLLVKEKKEEKIYLQLFGSEQIRPSPPGCTAIL